MKICLIGSMTFLDYKKRIAYYLSKEYEVVYSSESAKKYLNNEQLFRRKKQELMKKHVQRIEWADAVIVVNLPRQIDLDYWQESYIGGNTLGEIFIAWYLGKQLYSWFPIPRGHMFYEELSNMGIRVWQDRRQCNHNQFENLTRNYVICKVCGLIEQKEGVNESRSVV